jgi:hypothetical protein
MKLKILLCIFLICIVWSVQEVNARRKYPRYCETLAASAATEHESAEVAIDEEVEGQKDAAVETSSKPWVTRRPLWSRRQEKKMLRQRRRCPQTTVRTDDAKVVESDSKDNAEQSVVCPAKPENSTDGTENPLCVAQSTKKRPSRPWGYRYYGRRCRRPKHSLSEDIKDRKWRKICNKKKLKKHNHRQMMADLDNIEDDGNDADEEEEVVTAAEKRNENLSDEYLMK